MTCYYTHNWILEAVDSFRRFFPSKPILFIDNNPPLPECVDEKRYIRSVTSSQVIRGLQYNRTQPSSYCDHGLMMDLARDFCESQNIDVMLHIEPDTFTTGYRWYYSMLKAIEDGAWMCGTNRLPFGPIHPTPSMWRLDRKFRSFSHCPKGDDKNLANYKILIDETKHPAQADAIYRDHWDTGLANWFDCAVAGKDALVDAQDLIHFGGGKKASRRSVEQRYAHAHLPEPRFLPRARYPIY
jgi:hypothetical protein